MSFCDRGLRREWITWSADRSRKEWSDGAVFTVCCSTHQGLLNAVFMTRSGQVFMQKRAGGNFGRWKRWVAFSVSGDARTNWTDPGSWGILWRGVLMDSMDLERRDSVYYWHSSMSFCDPRLPKGLATWSAVRSQKEWVDRAEVRVYFSMHQELPNAVVKTRSDYVFIEKWACGIFRDWERWERLPHFLCIWRCQNELDGPRERGNIVGRSVDGFYEFGSLRFGVLLSFLSLDPSAERSPRDGS
jgi:hypothetical protein